MLFLLYIEGNFFLYKRKKNISLELDISYLTDMSYMVDMLYMIDMIYMSYQADMYYQDDMLLYIYDTITIYLFIYVSRETFICSAL